MSSPTPPATTEYVVVARGRSAARFLPEEGFEAFVNLASAGEPERTVRVRVTTRWVNSGFAEPLPRELVVEVRGPAPSIDVAANTFVMAARPIATVVSFVANVSVSPVEVHLAYDCTPGHGERRFLEVYLPDESGSVGDGRVVRVHLVAAMVPALLGSPEVSRIGRALRQYELALRQWYVGGEWLALSYLYMAVEALTKASLRKVVRDRATTMEDLARTVQIDPDDPDRPRWLPALETWCRSEIIFAGDSETYKLAKAASDGLEHGFLELDEVARKAIAAADKTFAHVRNAIIDLLELPPSDADELRGIKVKDVQSRRLIVHGTLRGANEDPAPEGEPYPLLEWSSSVGSVTREGSEFTVHPKENFTVRTRPGTAFDFAVLEQIGRLEDGQVPVFQQAADLEIEHGHPPVARALMSDVMALVDAAATSRPDVPLAFPRVQAFNLFGQGVAFFQATQTLLVGNQPVEALMPLRGLVIVAARFEQISGDTAGGLGIVVRLCLDALVRQFSGGSPMAPSPGAAARGSALRSELLASAEAIGLPVPDVLDAVEDTGIWTSLTFEMTLAGELVAASNIAAGLHIDDRDEAPDTVGFRTKQEPGAFSDGVAAACAIAQLSLVGSAASVFGWAVDEPARVGLLEQAVALNEASFNPPERRCGTTGR